MVIIPAVVTEKYFFQGSVRINVRPRASVRARVNCFRDSFSGISMRSEKLTRP